jgi:predicted ATP-grasp superfamily ATP-dependent carboligase
MARVVIAGASGRAAAASARRAGLEPAVVDLFADRDTQRLGETVRCPLADFPHAIPDLVRFLPPGPVAYTGGLENHPAVIDRLAADRDLLGNDGTAVAAVREPGRLREMLRDTGLRFPRHYDEPPGVACLIKHRSCSGGLGVARPEALRRAWCWIATPVAKPPGVPPKSYGVPPGSYLEEFIPGRVMSAQFRDAIFLGATEQLAGEPWLHAPPFHYAGNVGPVAIDTELVCAFADAARRLSLCGPWGIDYILNDGGAFVLEVNPRYTAAMEVLELSRELSLSFSRESETSADVALAYGSRLYGRVVGKAVYYAPFSVRFPPSGPWDTDLETPWNPWRIPGFADIPHPGEPFQPGRPVLTIFAADSTPAAVRAKLMATARGLDIFFAREIAHDAE